jgi:hypothetical protein
MERRNIYSITPSLAFIYQVLNKDNYNYLPSQYKLIADSISNSFTYQDALDCCSDLENPKWGTVKLFLEKVGDVLEMVVGNDISKYDKTKYDPEFLLVIFKKEVIEMKNGNVTVLHAKNSGFLVLDIISQLVSGSYEGYKWKCQRNENDPQQKALSIYDEMNFDFNDSRNDNSPDLRARLISGNISIFNNSLIIGESTLLFYFLHGSITFPSVLIRDLQLSKKTTLSIIRLANKLNKITESILAIYSFPYDKADIYVYPSIPFGYKIENRKHIHDYYNSGYKIENWNIYDYYDSYCSDNPWMNNFELNYKSQVRIIDLCFTKYAYEDGVRINQYINSSKEELNNYLNEIKKIVLSDQDLIGKIEKKIDISINRENDPLKSIISTDKSKNIDKTNQTNKTWKEYLKDLSDLLSENTEPIPYFENKILKTANKKMAEFYSKNILKRESSEFYNKFPDHFIINKIKMIRKHTSEYKFKNENSKIEFELLVYEYILRNGIDENIRFYNQNYAKYLYSLFYDYAKEYGRNQITDEMVVGGSRNPDSQSYIEMFWKPMDEKEKKKLKDFIKESNDARLILNYIYFLGKRWKKGEINLIKFGKASQLYDYIESFINDRWPEAEDKLMKDPSGGIYYSFYILKKRWPDMEPYLYKYRNTVDGNKNMEEYLKYFHLTEDDLKKNFINKSRSPSRSPKN